MVDWNSVNILAVLIGGVLYMMYGGIYYSSLLGKKSRSNEIKDHQSEGPLNYLISVIIAFISSFFIGILVQSIEIGSWIEGLALGFMIGLLISMVYLKNRLFGLMSQKAFLIAIGDHLIIFTLLGALHGVLN